MKDSLGRRGLALLLTLVLCLSLAPAAWAANNSITISGPNTVKVGDEIQLSVSVKDDAGNEVTPATIAWSSGSESVATVDQNGKVTGVATGTVTITATCTIAGTQATGTYKVSVEDDSSTTPTVKSIAVKIDPLSLTLEQGKSGTLRASVEIEWSDGQTHPDPAITYTWSKSGADVIDISGAENTTRTISAKAATGKATVTVRAEAGGKGADATCEVNVKAPEKPVSITGINPTGPIIRDPEQSVQLKAITDPANQAVTWTSSDEEVVTITPNGTMTGHKPGEAVITATAGDGSGTNQTATVNVLISGLDVDTKVITLMVNSEVNLPEATPYGAADGKKYVSKDPYIAQVTGNMIKLKAYTLGETDLIVSDKNNNYKKTIHVVVTADPTTTIDAGDLKIGETLSFSSLSRKFAEQLSGNVNYVTGLTVSTAQGTLFYRYTNEAEPGKGVGNETYYRYPSAGQRDLEDITFVPKSSFAGGQVVISYTATTRDNDTYACSIIVNVVAGDSSGGTDIINLSTKYNTAVKFEGTEFDKVCRDRLSANLNYVTFSLPNERQGVLYTNYSTTGNYGSRVTLNTHYSLRNLDDVWFVPAPGFTGTAVVYYIGHSRSSTGATYTGQIRITVGSDSASSIGGVPYNAAQGGAVTFDDADFNDYCRQILDSSQNLNYIRFNALPDSSQGTLYYNYRSASSTGTPVYAGTTYYYGTYTPRLDRVTFVPAADYAGTVRIPFTGWTNTGTQFSGNVEINVRGGAGSGDIHYTCAPGKTVRFSNGDFTRLCRDLTERTLDYIRFQALPSSSDGVLYHNSNTRVNTTTSYRNASSGYRISNLSFQASRNFSGSVDIPFVGYASGNGESFSGVITIDANSSGNSGGDSIRYSTDYNSAAVFDRDDFDDLSQWETDRNVSSVRFELPSSSQGELYRNYRSSSNKGTRITSSSTSISASELDRVAFVPASGYTGTVYLDFTARASNSDEFRGTVEIAVDRPGAEVTARYSTRTAPVNFQAADFRRSGSTLSSIQFGAMPSSSEGYVYYQYVSPTRYGRQASAGTTYRTSGSNLISDLSFVPRAGFSGTVTIPYTGTNSNNSTFEGEVVITVSPSYGSAYFSDMGSYSDAQRAAVDYLRENGITNGISATQYGPEHSITRGDFAVMVYQAFGLNNVSASGAFTDVPSGVYYANAVNALHAMGVVSGIGNGAYGPSHTLTRQDAVCMVQRAMRAVGWSAGDGYASTLNGYSDGNAVSGYAQGAMAFALQRGYLPTVNGRLAPKDPLTRVDMAQIIHRVLTY